MKRRSITLVRDEDDREYQVEMVDDDGHLRATTGQQQFVVARDGNGRLRVSCGRTAPAWTIAAGDVRWVFVDGVVYELTESRPQERARSRAHHGSLAAPMPATVRRIMVKPGDAVRPGDTLIILEAMKMELPIKATAHGIVGAVNCREGELVQPGVALTEISESATDQ